MVGREQAVVANVLVLVYALVKCRLEGSSLLAVGTGIVGFQRGIIGGDVQTLPLCKKAQDEFGMYCEADIVPMTLLYGGKIAAALSRQHPR